MKSCEPYKTLLAEVVAGSAEEQDRSKLESHLSSCPDCARELETASAIVELTRTPHADPGDAFWDAFLSKVELKTENESARPTVFSLAAIRPWSMQIAAAVVILIAGVWIGRVSLIGEESPDLVQGQHAALEQRTFEYLDRSKTVLLEVANFDASGENPSLLNFDRRQDMADALIVEASNLKDDLSRAHQAKLEQLVSDLEIILLQIANIESAYDIPGIEMIQSGMDRKSVLFKIDVESMRRSEPANPFSNTAPTRTSAL